MGGIGEDELNGGGEGEEVRSTTVVAGDLSGVVGM